MLFALKHKLWMWRFHSFLANSKLAKNAPPVLGGARQHPPIVNFGGLDVLAKKKNFSVNTNPPTIHFSRFQSPVRTSLIYIIVHNIIYNNT